MHVSVVIPAFNEQDRLPVTLRSIEAYRGSKDTTVSIDEVIVVDDGSADDTSNVAKSYAGSLPLRVVRLPKNRGKGAALRTGVLEATSEYVLIYDADGATPIEELENFARYAQEQNPDVMIGNRLGTEPDKQVSMSWYRRVIGRTYHALCKGLTPGIDDAACGFKLFKQAVAKDLFTHQKIDRFAYDIEILSLAMRRGYKILELPVRWTAIAGSKINLVSDSWDMFWSVLGLYFRGNRE